MSKREKLYRRLDEMEASFRTELLLELQQCADGRNDLLFLCKEFWPAGYPQSLNSERGDGLLQQAIKIQDLKQQLDEDNRRSLADSYCECCRNWADHSNAHRGSAQSIAQKLLEEIAGGDAGY